MKIRFVQKNTPTSINGGVTSPVVMNSITVEAGDLIVVTVSVYNGNEQLAISSVSDGTNLYTVRSGAFTTGSTRQIEVLAWAIAKAKGTFTPSIALSNADANDTFVYGGVSSFALVRSDATEITWDVNAEISAVSSDMSAGPISTATHEDLIVGTAGFMVSENTNQNWASPSGWTNLFRHNDGFNVATAHDSGYWLPGAVQTNYTAQWSHTNYGSGGGGAGVIAVFRAKGIVPSVTDDFNRADGDPGDAWTATRLRNTTVLRVDSQKYALNSSPFSHNAAYTAIGWFYLDVDTNDYSHIFHIGGTDTYDGNTDFVATDTDGTTLRVGVYGGDSNGFVTGLSLSTGQWYKCAIVREGVSSLKVYIEPAGTPLATVRATYTSNVSARASATRLQIGSYNFLPMDGRVGGWRFWTSALSVADINTEFTSLTPVTSGAWASLPVDGTSVTALLTDQTANARNFTQVGVLSTAVGPTFNLGKFEIYNNEIDFGSLQQSRGAVYTKKRWGRAQSSSVVVRNAISGDSYISLWLLCNPNNGSPNGYQVSFSASNWYITRVVNGTGTDIANGSWTLSVGTRVTARVSMSGRLSIETGAGEAGNITDTTYTSGYPGVEFYTTSTLIRADDWEATGEYEDAVKPTTTGELKDVSLQRIYAPGATEVSSGTYTWDLADLPEGDGCLVVLMLGWNTSNDGYCVSASLSQDGNAQTITPRLSNDGNCECQYIAFPRITSRSQILSLTFVRPGANNMHARPYLFKVVGHDTERMIGAYGRLTTGSYSNALPMGNAVLVTYPEGGNASGGNRDWEIETTSGYSTGYSEWVGRYDATSVAVQSGYPHNVVEIRRGEKVRRKRYISVGGEEYTRQPMPGEPVEANPEFNLHTLWTPSLKRNVAYGGGFALARSSVEYRGSAKGLCGYRPQASLDYSGTFQFQYRRRFDYTASSFLFWVKVEFADGAGSNLFTNDGTSGVGMTGYGTHKLAMTSGLGFTESTTTFLDGGTHLLGATYIAEKSNGRKLYIDGVKDATEGSTVGDYGFLSSTQDIWFFGRPSFWEVAGEYYLAACAERVWTDNEFAQLAENPWQLFIKPRRTIFTGTPVLTHKRRRML